MNDRDRLKTLATKLKRFRDTPIVDDDFPALRDDADWALAGTLQYLDKAPPQPTVVCLCGSTRFYEAFCKANYDETMAGRIVLSVGFYRPTIKQRVTVDGCMGEQERIVETHGQAVGCTDAQKVALDELHFRKIEMADEILVLNVGGYIGRSTANEIEHAHKLGRDIRWLELLPDGRPKLSLSNEALAVIGVLRSVK